MADDGVGQAAGSKRQGDNVELAAWNVNGGLGRSTADVDDCHGILGHIASRDAKERQLSLLVNASGPRSSDRVALDRGDELVGIGCAAERLRAHDDHVPGTHILGSSNLALKGIDDFSQLLDGNSRARVDHVPQPDQLALIDQWLEHGADAGSDRTPRACREDVDAVAADIDGRSDARRRLYGHAKECRRCAAVALRPNWLTFWA